MGITSHTCRALLLARTLKSWTGMRPTLLTDHTRFAVSPQKWPIGNTIRVPSIQASPHFPRSPNWRNQYSSPMVLLDLIAFEDHHLSKRIHNVKSAASVWDRIGENRLLLPLNLGRAQSLSYNIMSVFSNPLYTSPCWTCFGYYVKVDQTRSID